jgi:hypothetical protein
MTASSGTLRGRSAQAPSSTSKPSTASSKPSARMAVWQALSGPTREEIARRAYELFLERGGEHGHADEDWIQAERELRLGRY